MRHGSRILLILLMLPGIALADEFGGVEFPDGARSFADAVVDFSPASGPTAPHLVAANALGTPDYAGVNSCGATCSFASLGSGGSITLRFTDNVLTGSGDGDDDLWIFEVGPDVEDTFVEISSDGATWHAVGKVFGSTSGVDIDAHGFGPQDAFAWVRLTDDPNEGGAGGSTAGADIDAVGAISSTAGCVIDSVDPAGPWSVGATVQIHGNGFDGDSVPRIGGAVAAPYTLVSANQITATVPALGDGSFVLDVLLSNGQTCELAGLVVPTESLGWGALKSNFR